MKKESTSNRAEDEKPAWELLGRPPTVREVLEWEAGPLTFKEIRERVGPNKTEGTIHAEITKGRRSYQIAILGEFESEAISPQEPKYMLDTAFKYNQRPVAEVLREHKRAITFEGICRRAGSKHPSDVTSELFQLRRKRLIEAETRSGAKGSILYYRWIGDDTE